MSFLDSFFGSQDEEHANWSPASSKTENLELKRDVSDAEEALERAEELQQLAAKDETADQESAAQLVEQRRQELAEAREKFEQSGSKTE